jgi:type I restriction enzyme S subunit
MTAEQLRPGWRKVKFGDVVRDVKNTTKNPSADRLERVVGLDHLDPESLPLRRWDELADLPDGTSFTRTFKAGQVLFGKRRAYQRKVAIPDFDGICSGDILVFEPSSPDLLPEFLPYLVQSDGFFDHALGTSAGSLSPRTKWQELAKYEFALPPLDEQKRVVGLLGTAEEAVEQNRRALLEHERLLEVFIRRSFGNWRTSCAPLPVPSIGALQMGRQKAPKYETGVGSTSYLRVANIGHLRMDVSALESMDFAPDERVKYELRSGDVLITEGDIVSALNVGRPAIFPGADVPVCFQNTLIRLRPLEGFDSHFVMGLVEGARLHGVLAAAASTTTVSHLGLKRLSAVTLPVPERHVREEFAASLRALLGFGECLAEATARLQSVLKVLRSEVLR